MKTIIFTLLLIFTLTLSLFSQTGSYIFSSSSGTFSAITGGTVLGSTSNDDQVFNNNTTGEAPPQSDIGFPIGFSFNYNGTLYDRFAVNNNGWILLGNGTFTIGGTYTPISNIASSGFANIISVLGRDIQGQTGSELSYKLTGSSPNQTLVIQWINYRRYNIASGESFNFQIRLNESNYSVEFVYGVVTTTNTSTSTQNNPTQLGLRGLVNTDFKNRTTTSSWSSSSAGTLNTKTMRLTASVKPASGLKYTWSPANMTYSSSTSFLADTSKVKKNSTNNAILKIQIITSGLLNPINVTGFSLNTNGTTSTADISNAKVWFTGSSSVFEAANQFGTVVSSPNGAFSIAGSRQLLGGTNYFWVTYDIPVTAVTSNSVDGECISVTIGTARTPSIQAPAGSRKISNAPLNGTYAVGLALFNKLTGNDLTYKKITGIVKRDLFSKPEFDGKIKRNSSDVSLNENLFKISTDVEKDTFILINGNELYSGAHYIDITPELKARFGNELNLNGMAGVYPSISSAVNDLGNRGVTGPVVFSLTDAAYNSETYPITLNNISGSEVNTITFKPAAGINTQINMTSGQVMFKILNSNYIIFDGSNTENGTTRNLSIISNYANVSNCIWIGSSHNKSSNYITVKNCNIKAGENTLGSSPVIVSDGIVSGNPGVFSNITLQNNFIEKGRIGIFINGGTIPQNGSNIYIYDNVINSTGINSVGYLGIYLQGVTAAIIKSNQVGNIDNTGTEDDKGIWVANGSHIVTVERNKVYNIGYSGTEGYGGHGLYVSSNHLNADVLIKNNLIYNIYGDGWNHSDASFFLDNPSAIVLYSSTPQSGISIYNNSVNLHGNTLNQNSSISGGIFLTSGSTADIRNNSIVNNLGVVSDSAYGSCGIYSQNSNGQFLNIDYNNYYVNPSGNGVKAIGKISTNASLTLSALKAATGKDKSSLNYISGYTSDSDLMPDITSSNSWSLNGRGSQLISVYNDYSGNIRSTSVAAGAPDIGAYEFTPSSEPPALTQTGTIADGNTTFYLFGGDSVASVTWHGGNLPSSVISKYYSGTNPPAASTGNYGNSYITFSPAGGTGYTFDIKLYYDPALIGTITNENRISMANYTGAVWTHYETELNNILYTVTKSGLADLTVFTIDDNEYPLPVVLKSFSSSVNERNVLLKWTTEIEINNSGFDIERKSEFENNWNKIGFVAGSGNTTEEKNYSFNDIGLKTAKYYYRLKQVNYNSSYEYFNLTAGVIIGKPVKFDLSQNYPNPSNPNCKINFQMPQDADVMIKIYDVQGREVKTIIDSYLLAGYYTADFDGSNVASGIYFYRINTAGFSKTLKLIIVK